MSQQEKWEPCPRCGSKKVQGRSKWAMAMASFGMAGCLIWVGLLFPLLWILVPVFFLVSVLLCFGKSQWECQDCKFTWEVGKPKEGTLRGPED